MDLDLDENSFNRCFRWSHQLETDFFPFSCRSHFDWSLVEFCSVLNRPFRRLTRVEGNPEVDTLNV